MLDKVIVDMRDRIVLPIEQGAFTGAQGWINAAREPLDIFRVDPHEFSAATDFYIRRVKLAALEKANQSYHVSWAYSDASAGTVTLSYDNDKNPSNGMTQFASGIATASSGAFTWNTTGMPGGTYYIYASVTDGTERERDLLEVAGRHRRIRRDRRASWSTGRR